jgi:hypothetical protein
MFYHEKSGNPVPKDFDEQRDQIFLDKITQNAAQTRFCLISHITFYIVTFFRKKKNLALPRVISLPKLRKFAKSGLPECL